MRIKKKTKKNNEACGDGQDRVRPHSRRASLVNAFRLDKHGNNIEDIETAQDPSRKSSAPSDFAPTTDTVVSDEGSDTPAI